MCVVFDGARHALGARCSGRAGAVGSQPVVQNGEARLGEHRRASGLRESTVLVVDYRPLHVCGVFTNERGAPVRDRQCAEDLHECGNHGSDHLDRLAVLEEGFRFYFEKKTKLIMEEG